MNTNKQTTELAILDVLAASSKLTAAEIAVAAGRGRSTIGKALAKLEKAGRVKREVGGRDGAQRPPDRWSAVKRRASRSAGASNERLRPGELDDLVHNYLREHAANGSLSPSAIANGLSRSSGAVTNCLVRLVRAGKARETSKAPRRYSPAKGARA